jgi:hypothetical protein
MTTESEEPNDAHASGGSQGSLFARAVDRQKFLAGLVIAGVAAGSGRTQNAFAALDSKNGRTAGGLVKSGIRLGPDGFPFLSVAGTFIGVDGDRILVAGDRPMDAPSVAHAPKAVVPVTLTPTTAIAGRGVELYGDASVCRAGDRVNVGTQWDSSGGRVAEYVEVNMLAGMAWLTSVGNDQLTFTNGYDSSSPTQYQAKVMPQARFDLLNGTQGTLHDFKAGDYVHLVAYMESPQPDPSTPMWLRLMAQSGDGSW